MRRAHHVAVGTAQVPSHHGRWMPLVLGLLLAAGCGYSTRPGIPAHLRTIYIAPFANRIDISTIATNVNRFPIYRHGMEVALTNAVIERYQFTGLLRPTKAARADCRIEGELLEFRRDALRYDADQKIEEWRLSLVARVRFFDQTTQTLVWEESQIIGDTTYFALGASSEPEASALDRATEDLARRIVERTVEDW